MFIYVIYFLKIIFYNSWFLCVLQPATTSLAFMQAKSRHYYDIPGAKIWLGRNVPHISLRVKVYRLPSNPKLLYGELFEYRHCGCLCVVSNERREKQHLVHKTSISIHLMVFKRKHFVFDISIFKPNVIIRIRPKYSTPITRKFLYETKIVEQKYSTSHQHPSYLGAKRKVIDLPIYI